MLLGLPNSGADRDGDGVAPAANHVPARTSINRTLKGFATANGGTLLRRFFISSAFLVTFLLLNHPAVILLSQLGTVVWYPAAGVSMALLLGVGPSYAILVAAAGALAGRLFYGQSFLTYGETVGALGMAIAYGGASHALRNILKIDLGLRRRTDVFRYVAVTTCACVLSTLIGVACLAGDRSIPWHSFPKASLLWFLGDEIALLGVSPFLLIHVFPWIRHVLSGESNDFGGEGDTAARASRNMVLQNGQAAATVPAPVAASSRARL